MSKIWRDREDAYLGVHPLRSVQGKFRGQQANVTPHVKFILQPILLKTQAVQMEAFQKLFGEFSSAQGEIVCLKKWGNWGYLPPPLYSKYATLTPQKIHPEGLKMLH